MTDRITTPSIQKQLPPDPEGRNDHRAAWAGKALDDFIVATGTDEEDAVGDLLVDLMHWCDRNNYDFDLAFDRALSHYEAETATEQASTVGKHACQVQAQRNAPLDILQAVLPYAERELESLNECQRRDGGLEDEVATCAAAVEHAQRVLETARGKQ
jgi:hypothetical protein